MMEENSILNEIRSLIHEMDSRIQRIESDLSNIASAVKIGALETEAFLPTPRPLSFPIVPGSESMDGRGTRRRANSRYFTPGD